MTRNQKKKEDNLGNNEIENPTASPLVQKIDSSIRKRRGRPKKTPVKQNESNLENIKEIDELNAESDSESENGDNATNSREVIFIKDLLEFRNDNYIYIISSSGEALDQGAKNLI